MPDFRQLMSELEVEVTSPDRRIRVRRRHGGDMWIEFGYEAYRHYTAPVLAGQLAAACRLLWVAHRRASLRAYAIATGRDPSDGNTAVTPEYRAFHRARERVPAVGLSEYEWVLLQTRGWTEWSVDLRPDTVRELREAEFIGEFVSAANHLVADYQRRIAELRRRLLP